MKGVLEALRRRGLKCGKRIAKLVKMIHPNAFVVPLYRSAIAVEEKKWGKYPITVVHLYGDPHYLGYKRITRKALKKEDFHDVMIIFGDRDKPDILFIFDKNKIIRLKASNIPFIFNILLEDEKYKDYIETFIEELREEEMKELMNLIK